MPAFAFVHCLEPVSSFSRGALGPNTSSDKDGIDDNMSNSAFFPPRSLKIEVKWPQRDGHHLQPVYSDQLQAGLRVQLCRAFPVGVGGGLVSNRYFNFQNEMGASFLCALRLVVVVGKNTEARYEFVVHTLVSNHLILTLILIFFTRVGGGCLLSGFKNASHVVMEVMGRGAACSTALCSGSVLQEAAVQLSAAQPFPTAGNSQPL